jgi:hypothetical protein
MAETADLRKESHILFDRLIEQQALVMLARWFRERADKVNGSPVYILGSELFTCCFAVEFDSSGEGGILPPAYYGR